MLIGKWLDSHHLINNWEVKVRFAPAISRVAIEDLFDLPTDQKEKGKEISIKRKEIYPSKLLVVVFIRDI